MQRPRFAPSLRFCPLASAGVVGGHRRRCQSRGREKNEYRRRLLIIRTLRPTCTRRKIWHEPCGHTITCRRKQFRASSQPQLANEVADERDHTLHTFLPGRSPVRVASVTPSALRRLSPVRVASVTQCVLRHLSPVRVASVIQCALRRTCSRTIISYSITSLVARLCFRLWCGIFRSAHHSRGLRPRYRRLHSQ